MDDLNWSMDRLYSLQQIILTFYAFAGHMIYPCHPCQGKGFWRVQNVSPLPLPSIYPWQNPEGWTYPCSSLVMDGSFESEVDESELTDIGYEEDVSMQEEDEENDGVGAEEVEENNQDIIEPIAPLEQCSTTTANQGKEIKILQVNLVSA